MKKLSIEAPYFDEEVAHFDTVFSNHPFLLDFKCDFRIGAERNWFRSCHVPLERFAVNQLWHADATLDTLENCCKDSLQTIKFGQ